MRLDAMEKSQQEILSLLRAQTAPMRRNQFEDPLPNQLTNVTDLERLCDKISDDIVFSKQLVSLQL